MRFLSKEWWKFMHSIILSFPWQYRSKIFSAAARKMSVQFVFFKISEYFYEIVSINVICKYPFLHHSSSKICDMSDISDYSAGEYPH